MWLSCFQNIVLMFGNLILLVLGVIVINALIQRRLLQRISLLIWGFLWIYIICLSSGDGVIFKSLITIIYTISLFLLFLLLCLAYRFKSLFFILYDFLLFLKSRLIMPKSGVVYGINSFELLKMYLRYVGMYIYTMEFIPKKIEPKIIKDKLLNFTLNFSTYSGMFCMFNEIFAYDIYKFAATKSSPKIIDCGSNIGLSILYFKSLYPDAEIIGFEPCSQTFEILQKNVEDNNLKNVVVYNKALSDKDEKISFYVSKDYPAHGGTSAAEAKNNQKGNLEQVVDAVKLSEYITQPVAFLKMDIEGAEDLVLKELADSGKLEQVKCMILEYHHHLYDTNKDCLAAVLKYFEENNFGYKFNSVEKASAGNKMRNTLIIYAYNKSYDIKS